MRKKNLIFHMVCLVILLSSWTIFSGSEYLYTFQSETEMEVEIKKISFAMKDITVVATALADFITDNGFSPRQDGIYDEKSRIYMMLSPFYVKILPTKDPWGNNYRVYCSRAIEGVYGITFTVTGEDEFLVVSFGRDGIQEDWEFNYMNPVAGLHRVDTLGDCDKDLVMWNGSWIRVPFSRR